MTSQQVVDDEHFKLATARAAKIAVPDKTKLDFYGLFKQATIGDCTVEEPSRWRMIEHAKWEAWNKLSGISQQQAKTDYVALVAKHDLEFAATLKPIVPNTNATTALPISASTEAAIPNPIAAATVPASLAEDIYRRPPRSRQEQLIQAIEALPRHLLDFARKLMGDQQSITSLHLSRNDSPIPTWLVFCIGVLLLCFMDDNVSFANILMNGLGVGVLTAAIISLQLR